MNPVPGQNPYTKVGEVVRGDAFVGREHELHFLAQRLGTGDPASVSIVGLRRIGKTSLAHRAVRDNAIGLGDNVVSVWLNAATVAVDLASFLRAIGGRVVSDLKKRDALSEPIVAAAGELETAERDDLRLMALQDLLGAVRADGFWVIAAVDEFDRVRSVFDGQEYAFSAMRELAHDPDARLAWLAISRRPLSAVVAQAGVDDSTLEGIFAEVRLRPFDQPDFAALAARAAEAGVELHPETIAEIERVNGGHPYLASHLLNDACNEPKSSPSAVLTRVEPTLVRYFRELESQFRSDGRLEALLEVLVGPVESATPYDAAELEHYGLAVRGASGHFEPFSPFFGEFLRSLARSVEYWPLWSDTERSLRRIIVARLELAYSAPLDWAEVARERPELAPVIGSLERTRDKDLRKFGGRASANLLDYAYPHDLFLVIRAHWRASFEPVLGRDVSYWAQRFNILAKVRTPMAHSREHAVTQQDTAEARGACLGIREAIERYERSRENGRGEGGGRKFAREVESQA